MSSDVYLEAVEVIIVMFFVVDVGEVSGRMGGL